MSDDMNLSVNGNSRVPPGFRFHPTEDELLQYYLRKKVACERIDLDVIRDIDLNKLEPWDIQEKCKIGSTPQNDWYFFSHKDKKYPTGTRTNRATAAGFWKATGRDKAIHSNLRRIGMRKTLVFYRGRAPHGQKSDWIMHEYRIEDNTQDSSSVNTSDSGPEEGWVICRVFKKKNYHKALESPSLVVAAPSSHSLLPRNDGVLDQILTYMGRSSSSSSCKQEKEMNVSKNIPSFSSNPFMQLPGLEAPQPDLLVDIGPPSDWAALDRLVASQLNGQPCRQFSGEFAFSFRDDGGDDGGMMGMQEGDDHEHQPEAEAEADLWSFGRSSSSLSSSSDPLCHLSV